MASKTPYSRPTFEQSFTLHSLQAQRVVQRVLRRTVHALYGIEVILRIIGDEKAIDEVDGIIRDAVTHAASELEQEQSRLNLLMEENGIDETPNYTHPYTFTAKISSPQIGQFIGLIRKLDAVMIARDTLWLTGVISNQQRADGNFDGQQKLTLLARHIIDIETRARQSANSQGKQEEVEAVVPVMEEVLEAEED